MNRETRRIAGILLVMFPTVVYGGATLLSFLIDPASGYTANPIRQDLWRAGHAHAATLLILSLVALRYVDEAAISEPFKRFVRYGIPSAAILLPAAFFLSIIPADATRPNALVYVAFPGGLVLAAALLVLGIGLLRKPVGDTPVG